MAIIGPTNGKPSDPTNRMWAWGLLGGLLLPMTTSIAIAGVSIGASIGTLAGGAIGFFTGKQKQQRELETGVKKVRSPTLVNGGMAKGWLWGGVVGSLAGLAVGAIILLATGGTAAVAAAATYVASAGAAGAAPAYLSAAGFGWAATGLITNVAMTVKGAIRRREEMRADYREAEAFQMRSIREQQYERMYQEEMAKVAAEPEVTPEQQPTVETPQNNSYNPQRPTYQPPKREEGEVLEKELPEPGTQRRTQTNTDSLEKYKRTAQENEQSNSNAESTRWQQEIDRQRAQQARRNREKDFGMEL